MLASLPSRDACVGVSGWPLAARWPCRIRRRERRKAAAASAAVLGVAYAIQLMVVQPSLLRGEIDALQLWSQYNPHGLFIALENVGYLLLCSAMLLLPLLIGGSDRSSRIGRWWSAAWGALGVLALPVLVFMLGWDLEHQYEVAAIVAAWIGLIGVGLLTAVGGRRGADLGRSRPSSDVPDLVT